MVKRAKNPGQLTEEEKDMIHQIILRWGEAYANITTVNPKHFAKKFISLTKSKKKIVLSYLFLINSRKMEGGQVVAPSDLNKELAKTMLDNANTQDPTAMTTHVGGTAKNVAYINSTDMTKNLHLLQLADIYQNIKGKNEVRRQTRKGQRGRPPKDSDKTYTKPSGMPSVYKITHLFFLLLEGAYVKI